MMTIITEKELQEIISQSIKKCHWRKNVYGVNICTGNVLTCARAIEKGDCEIIQKFAEKEGEEE